MVFKIAFGVFTFLGSFVTIYYSPGFRNDVKILFAEYGTCCFIVFLSLFLVVSIYFNIKNKKFNSQQEEIIEDLQKKEKELLENLDGIENTHTVALNELKLELQIEKKSLSLSIVEKEQCLAEVGDFLKKYLARWIEINHLISTKLKDDNIKKDDLSIVAKNITDLLAIARVIVGVALQKDVSSNIKVWRKPSEQVLVTKWREYSDYEVVNHLFRANKELFYINDNKESINNFKIKHNQYKIRYNSAYTKVLLSEEKYWIGNDLPNMVRKRTYESDSDKYEGFYSSLAVFKIFNTMMQYDDLKKDGVNVDMGLLIFDLKDDTFDKKIVLPYGIFLAQSLYPILFGLDMMKRKMQEKG